MIPSLKIGTCGRRFQCLWKVFYGGMSTFNPTRETALGNAWKISPWHLDASPSIWFALIF
ncbi:hypothetical protein I7I53_07205 [Histoplasma capsulatum var. duboisii H88]|uniref:Uncharacterized protein n=1 Tax=Ajellomyces capsulatus (strain H88) TaxID=544711 RepID=A0A8A1LDB4_AJEC8|nr:hypothetical protein I7I53_07205 [Histoplasma capsulatum var. duboisii H88]